MPLARISAVALPCLLIAFFSLFATTATPAGQIVIHGGPEGSHLRLGVSGETLVVRGSTDPQQSSGCSFLRGGGEAVCPLAGVERIELVMGAAEDRITVTSATPVPLTARLGDGSDKFVGAGEADTCYSEGARRNRCVGGAGDDTCITGDDNSDCVGGPGDDYCRHGAGSDGCWGGFGADVCVMGAGADGCHGGPGPDRLFGESQPDQLYGGPGRDYCDGAPDVGYSYRCEEGPGG